MYGGGREKKTKVTKRSQQAAASAAAEAAADGVVAQPSKRDKWLKAKQKHEGEADEIGMLLMAKAGYDPQEFPRVLQRLTDTFGDTGQITYLSSHPVSSIRRRLLRDR